MIRAGVRADLKIGGEEISNAVSLSRMEMIPKCLPREYLAFLKITTHISTIPAPDHTVPYGTVLWRDAFPGHFVPGYDHAVPPGQKPFAHLRGLALS